MLLTALCSQESDCHVPDSVRQSAHFTVGAGIVVAYSASVPATIARIATVTPVELLVLGSSPNAGQKSNLMRCALHQVHALAT